MNINYHKKKLFSSSMRKNKICTTWDCYLWISDSEEFHGDETMKSLTSFRMAEWEAMTRP
jgi:hypothetical protein